MFKDPQNQPPQIAAHAMPIEASAALGELAAQDRQSIFSLSGAMSMIRTAALRAIPANMDSVISKHRNALQLMEGGMVDAGQVLTHVQGLFERYCARAGRSGFGAELKRKLDECWDFGRNEGLGHSSYRLEQKVTHPLEVVRGFMNSESDPRLHTLAHVLFKADKVFREQTDLPHSVREERIRSVVRAALIATEP